MPVDKSKTGWLLPGPPKTDDQQRELAAAGAQHFMDLTGKMHTWRDAIKWCRPGDTVYVYATVLVPTRRGLDELPPTAQVVQLFATLADRKGVLIEVYSGRRSDRKSQRYAMISDAVRALKSGGRRLMPTGYREPGRKVMKFTAAEMARAETVWRDVVKYPTWPFVQEHLPEGFTTARAYRTWGPRGAAPKRR